MFKNVNDFMILSIEERQNHIDLKDECIEIGGYNSTFYVGLLAHYIKTTIPPKRSKILLCHVCGNGKCSNPKHLYWGTYAENVEDKKKHGTFVSVYQSTVKKYGNDIAKQMAKENASKGGKNGGGHNRLDYENIKRRLESITDLNPEERGFVQKVAERWNISHTQASRFLKKHFNN